MAWRAFVNNQAALAERAARHPGSYIMAKDAATLLEIMQEGMMRCLNDGAHYVRSLGAPA